MYLDIVCYMHNSMLYCSIYTADTYIILLSSFAESYRQSLSWVCCMICMLFTDMCGRRKTNLACPCDVICYRRWAFTCQSDVIQ